MYRNDTMIQLSGNGSRISNEFQRKGLSAEFISSIVDVENNNLVFLSLINDDISLGEV